MSPAYPRPIRQIHQIEPTTECNLRCRYCPSPKLEQHRGVPNQHMDMDTYRRALHWCASLPQQGELSLTGIGETLLHPEWRDMMTLAREALPEGFVNFSTNGLLLDDEACAFLAPLKIGVFVSLHRPEKAGPAIQAARRHGIYLQENAAASVESFNWAGLVDWEVSAPADLCSWLNEGWGNVLVDGRITTCCIDAAGTGVVGTVWDVPGTLSVKPWSLCRDCHMTVPDSPIDAVLAR